MIPDCGAWERESVERQEAEREAWSVEREAWSVKRGASLLTRALRSTLYALTLYALVPSAAGEESRLPSPKGAAAIGTVTSRLGTGVLVALAEGAAGQPNEELLVGRPARLVALAKGNELLAAWGDWQEAGRIKLAVPRGTRHWAAFVTLETPLPGVAGEAVPNIRPGDIVYRAAAPRPAPDRSLK